MKTHGGVAALALCTIWSCSAQVLGPDGGTGPTVALVISVTSVTAPQAVLLSAVAADSSSISTMEFFEGTTKLATQTAAPFTYTLDVTAADNGVHGYTAKATDAEGLTGTSGAVALVVSIPGRDGGASGGDGGNGGADGGTDAGTDAGIDAGRPYGGDGGPGDTIPPIITLIASQPMVVSPGTVRFVATATDEIGVVWVELWDNQTKVAQTSTPSASGAYDFTLSFTIADNRTHLFTARAFDAAYNTAVSEVVVVTVAIPPPPVIKDVSCGIGFLALLKSDGHLYTAGSSAHGATGGASSTDLVLSPVITGAAAYTSASFLYTALFIASSDGSVRCLGEGLNKQCGSGGTGGPTPVTVAGFSGAATQVAIGASACARRTDGTLWCWSGYQGNPTTNNTATPLAVLEADGRVITDCAKVFGCAETMYLIREDGSLWGWGRNDSAQVGDGTTAPRPTPVRIVHADASPILDAVKVSCGVAHKAVLESDGGVLIFGSNTSLQLGIPGQPSSTGLQTAARVTGLSGVVDLAAGYTHTVAVDSNGAVFTWGSDVYGELGNGSSGAASAVVTHVTGLPPNVVKVAAGNAVSYALTADGQLYGWGQSGMGVSDAGTPVVHPVQITVP